MSEYSAQANPGAVYDELGEFHDLFMDQPWARLQPVLQEAFGAFGRDRRIVDVGAGSGLGVLALARVTQARITALEPNLVMRTALTARVADRPELAEQVTVHAGSVPQDLLAIPDTVDGVVCANMLGHLTQHERSSLYAWLDRCLAAEGAAVLTTQDDDDSAITDEPFEQRRTLGDYEYRAFYEQAAHDYFRSRYEVWHGEELLRSKQYEGQWETVTYSSVQNQIRGLSLTASKHDAGIVLIRRP